MKDVLQNTRGVKRVERHAKGTLGATVARAQHEQCNADEQQEAPEYRRGEVDIASKPSCWNAPNTITRRRTC